MLLAFKTGDRDCYETIADLLRFLSDVDGSLFSGCGDIDTVVLCVNWRSFGLLIQVSSMNYIRTYNLRYNFSITINRFAIVIVLVVAELIMVDRVLAVLGR